MRVFAGNTADPVTVVDQIRLVKEQFGVEELVFVGDRGKVKSKGREALREAGLRYVSALTDPAENYEILLRHYGLTAAAVADSVKRLLKTA